MGWNQGQNRWWTHKEGFEEEQVWKNCLSQGFQPSKELQEWKEDYGLGGCHPGCSQNSWHQGFLPSWRKDLGWKGTLRKGQIPLQEINFQTSFGMVKFSFWESSSFSSLCHGSQMPRQASSQMSS